MMSPIGASPTHLISILLVAMATSIPVSLAGYRPQCPLQSGVKRTGINPGADLTLGLMVSLHMATGVEPRGRGDPVCSESDVDYGMQQRLAAIAAIENWPDSIKLPGLTVGLDIFDLCSTYDLVQYATMRFANLRYNDLYVQPYNASQTDCHNKTLRLGVIGYGRSSWTVPSALFLEKFDIPVIASTSTSDALSDAEKFPNFFRVVPPDSAAIKALVSLMENFGWRYSTMVYTEGDLYGLSGLKALEDAVAEVGFCLSEPISIPQGGSDADFDAAVNKLIQRKIKVVIIWLVYEIVPLLSAVARIGGAAHDIQWLTGDRAVYTNFTELPGLTEAARSLLVASPYSSGNATFKTWLAQWHPGMEFVPDVGLKIDAVHAYLAAFSDAHQDKCGGQPGMCDELYGIRDSEFIEYVKQVNFVGIGGNVVAFDENGNPVTPYYEILQYKSTGQPNSYSYQKIGEWTEGGGLTLNGEELEFYGNNGSLIDPPSSVCEVGPCTDPRCDHRITFVIQSLFDLHHPRCDSPLSMSRFTQLEAARFAVQLINRDSSFLPDVRLSLTTTDICGDTERSNRSAFQLIQEWDFDGGFPSRDDKSYLLGMLHSGNSEKAAGESKIFQIVDMPLITSSATSPALSNKDMFGNFLRTVPSDIKQTAAMVDLLANLGLTYIQTVYSEAYGDNNLALGEAAKSAGICVANSLKVVSDTDFATVVRGLLAKEDAKTVVLFLVKSHAKTLFQQLDMMNVSPQRFQFIGSDTWGTKTDYIPGLESQALGALTIDFKSLAIPEFEDYFANLIPDTASDSFFNEYWTKRFQCNLPETDSRYGQNCSGSEMLLPSDVNSLGTENIINAIHVYAVALSNLINDTCQNGGICDALLGTTSEEWLSHLKEAQFVSPFGSGKTVKFDENGDGPALYSVYKLTEMNGEYSYKEVGNWDDVNGLNLTSDVILSMFSSECTGICLECNPASDTNQTSDREYFRIPGDLDIPVVLQLSEPGDGVTCGASIPEASLVLESLLYALDEINNNTRILPGVKLGVTVMDSCENPAIAVRRLVGFLGDDIDTWHSLVVLGPSRPQVAEVLARTVTDPSRIPMVSHSAASADLDNYSLVLHTSAPYNQEIPAIVEILKDRDWKYVGIAFSDTPYGTSNSLKFIAAAKEAGICIGQMQLIDDKTDFMEVVSNFSDDTSLNVIVAFVHQKDAIDLLAADEWDRDRRFVWIGTDAWDSPAVVSGREDAARGMLVVAHAQPDLPEIQDYFTNSNRKLQAASARNPFFRDYLEQLCGLNCQLDEQLKDSIQESLRQLSGKISALVNAFYVIAHGADQLRDSKCGSSPGVCHKFKISDPDEVLRAMKQVTLDQGAGGKPFSFSGSSVPAVYSIKTYLYDGQSGRFVTVGEWRDNQLDLNNLDIELAPESQRNSSGCSCDPVPSIQTYIWKWIDHSMHVWATVVLAVSAICGVLAILIVILFLSSRDSFVVQSASFSLSLWLLLGIILMYLLNVAFMFEPNPAICGIRRFGISFVYCVVYAAMIVKSIRANRFWHKKPGVDLNFFGSWSQSLLFLAFLLPEAFLVGEWLVLIPPDVTGIPAANDACGNVSLQRACSISNIDLTIFMMYAYFLVLVTFLSSFGAFGSSHAQHEGKSIFFSSLFSILILVAWACVLNFLDHEYIYGTPAISIGLTADATILLVFMFTGKVVALTKREKIDDVGTPTIKRKPVNFEERPENAVHVYGNAGATTTDIEVQVEPGGRGRAKDKVVQWDEVDSGDEVDPGDEVTKF